MGRGSSGAGGSLPGGSGSGVNPNNIKNERDLVSERGTRTADVDSVLTAARGISDEFGVQVGQFTVAEVGGKDSTTMAYSDGENVGFNSKYLDGGKMTAAYDSCVESGFHPSRGSKTAVEAVAAHELGHVMSAKVGEKLGYGSDVHRASETIVNQAVKSTKHSGSKSLASKISGYAKHSYAECVAEAVADVYCNGKKAAAESRAIVNTIKGYLK